MSKRSNVWLHFKTIDDKHVGVCHYCDTKISVKNCSTANLGRHLKAKHPTVPININATSPKRSSVESSVPTIAVGSTIDPTWAIREEILYASTSADEETGKKNYQGKDLEDEKQKETGKVQLQQAVRLARTGKKRKASPSKIQNDDWRTSLATNPRISEFESVGINVTKKLEKMDYLQAVHAEVLIHQILNKGLLHQLTATTKIVDQTPPLERKCEIMVAQRLDDDQ